MKTAADFSLGERTVAVFSHPNHELVVLGMIHALGCPLVFLTDGGAPERVAQTEAALKSIGHAAQVFFLDFSEQAFYGALARRDGAFFASVAEELAGRLSSLRAGAILTVPIELHNPIHDMSPVLCRSAAAAAVLRPAFYEAPLIYQDAGSGAYRINRFPASIQPGETCSYALPDGIFEAKVKLYHEDYHCLRDYLETLDCVLSMDGFRTEYYRRAPADFAAPSANHRARYEERGERLKKGGAVQEIITYRGHFLPLAGKLLARRRDNEGGQGSKDGEEIKR